MRMPEQKQCRYLALCIPRILLALLSLVCISMLVVMFLTFVAIYLGDWQFWSVASLLTIIAWLGFEYCADWKHNLELAVEHTPRACGRISVLIGFLIALLLAGYYGVPYVWEARYQSLRKAAEVRGYYTAVQKMRNEAQQKDLGAFESDNLIVSASFYEENPAVRILAFGKWDEVVEKAALSVEKKYRAIIDRKFVPVIQEGKTIDPEDYSAFRASAGVPRYNTPVVVAKIIGCIAVSESSRGNLQQAWSYVRLQLALGRMFAKAHSNLATAILRVINENSVATISDILLRNPRASLPRDIVDNLINILAEDNASRGLQYTIAAGFNIIDDTKSDPRYSATKWARKVGINMAAMAMIPYQLSLADMVKNKVSTISYAQVSNLQEIAKAKKQSLNSLFAYDYPFYFQACYLEWVLHSKIKLILLADVLNGLNKSTGKYPASLYQINLEKLSEDALNSPITGKPIKYMLLPGDKLKLWDDIPKELLKELDLRPLILES